MPIPRLQLFEFNDQRWLPSVLRDGLTGYLEALSRKFRFHEPMGALINDALARSGAQRIVDLCSGGGGPMLEIAERLSPEVSVLLTDRYPNTGAFDLAETRRPGQVRGHRVPVDATSVPAELSGMRTVINGLHHFPPEAATAVLRDAAERGEAIVVIDAVDRSVVPIATAPLLIVTTLLFMPLVRPMRWQYLLFTYLVPIMPLLIFWDGLVSHLRAYTVADYQAMTAELGGAEYTWTPTRIKLAGGARATALVGMPAASADA